GKVMNELVVPEYGVIQASMVDAANACVFVRAKDVGLRAIELPEDLEGNESLLDRLGAIRIAASFAMGISKEITEAKKKAVPYIGVVGPGADALLLSRERIEASSVDLSARMLSNGQPHRALPLTASLCVAVAARITGTLVHEAATPQGRSR